MPLYEYRCDRCGGYTTRKRTHEEWRDEVRHPVCCAMPMCKVQPSPGWIKFVGPGFHETDYPKASE